MVTISSGTHEMCPLFPPADNCPSFSSHPIHINPSTILIGGSGIKNKHLSKIQSTKRRYVYDKILQKLYLAYWIMPNQTAESEVKYLRPISPANFSTRGMLLKTRLTAQTEARTSA